MGTTKAPPESRHDASQRRIFHLDFTTSDGKRHRANVRVPSWEKDPNASLIGLQARLGTLTMDAVITRFAVSAPAKPKHLKSCVDRRAAGKPGKCECFPRWTEVEGLK